MCGRRVQRVLVLAFVTLSGAGCDGARHEVMGTVTYNGSPLARPGGQVVFVGPGGEQAAAPIDADGTYRATGVPSGANRVAVYYPHPGARIERASALKPGRPRAAGPAFLTPAKYASPDTSGLAITVTGDTVHDLTLTGPPIR